MGGCCAKPQAEEEYHDPKRERRSSLARRVSDAKARLGPVMNRVSRVMGGGTPLDPALNVCEALTGQWREFLNPDKEARVDAMRLPYMVKKLFLKATVTMQLKAHRGGVTMIMNFGFIKDVSRLEFHIPKLVETRLMGLTIIMSNVARRGRGGSLRYTVTEKKKTHTSVINSEFTPEIKGDAVYMNDETLFVYDEEPPLKFTCTWKRTTAATALDRELYVNYLRLRAEETEVQLAEAESAERIVELTLVEDAPD